MSWESRAVEEILREEAACSSGEWSTSGVCPCCGVSLTEEASLTDDTQIKQVCPSCEWESDVHYDV